MASLILITELLVATEITTLRALSHQAVVRIANTCSAHVEFTVSDGNRAATVAWSVAVLLTLRGVCAIELDVARVAARELLVARHIRVAIAKSR